MLDTAARSVERRLNADRADHQDSTVRCACGRKARYAGRRPKTFLSVLGPLRLERACTVTEPALAPAPTMYLGLDGTGVPVRPSEVEGRPGKQPDGSARTREGKLVTVWTAESRDKRGRPVRDPGSVSYNAAVESAAGRPSANTRDLCYTTSDGPPPASGSRRHQLVLQLRRW